MVNVRYVLTRSFFHRLSVSLNVAVILLHIDTQINPFILTHDRSLGEAEVGMRFVRIDGEVLFTSYFAWKRSCAKMAS